MFQEQRISEYSGPPISANYLTSLLENIIIQYSQKILYLHYN